MVIHKLANHSKSKGKQFAFSECGKALHIVGGDACSDWDGVTCKNCLRYQDKTLNQKGVRR